MSEVIEQQQEQAIKLNKFNVCGKDGAKARVFYSLDNRTDGRKCVTIYARDYGHDLAKVFVDGGYVNRSDSQTDYFEQGRVVLFDWHPLYKEARPKVEAWLKLDRARLIAKKLQAHHERHGAGFYVEVGQGRIRYAGAREKGGELEFLEIASGEWVISPVELGKLQAYDHNGRWVYI